MYFKIVVFSALACFFCESGLLAAGKNSSTGTQLKSAARPKAEKEPPPPQSSIKAGKTRNSAIKSRQAAGHWALGGLYPGMALKYITGGKSAWELRAQSGSGVLALGPRYYRYFTAAANPRLYFGIEADSLTFKAADSKGAGFAAGAFVGGEIFLTRHIGLLMDLGPVYLNLEDDKFSEAASGIEYVLNLGLYWHFK